jgi:aldose 1-epimerase
VPEYGGNLVGFGARFNGREVETFLQPSDEKPTRSIGNYGAPVLYPFPNRLRDGEAHFGGRTIRIDRLPGQRHAIHGLVRDVPWHVESRGADAAGAVIRCSVVSDPTRVLRQFPFPFRLTLTFRLAATRLRVGVEGENLGDAPLPMGFGWHPYFRLPLVAGSERSAAIVRIPARKQWRLDDTLVPTGETVDVPSDRDFRVARALGETHLDDVYTDLVQDGDRSSCELTDPAMGVTLRVGAGPTCREWVVYAPPSRPTICFEPYTCPTDAFHLSERGIDAGVIVVPPGGSWSDWLELQLTG